MANWNLEALAGAPGTSLLWRGTWSSALSYNPYDGVATSNGSSYISKTNNQNKNPLSSPSDWDLLAATGVTGPQGVNAFTTTTANFDLPAVGGSVVVTLVDASWVVIGQMLTVQTAGGSPADAYSLKVTAKTGNQVTLQNIATGVSGAGDMTKAVYDADLDNIIDAAEGLSESPIYVYQDHFLTGSDASYGCWIASGTGASKNQTSSLTDHPGIYQVLTGTSAGAAATGYVFMTAGNGYIYGISGAIAFRSAFFTMSGKPTSTAAQLSKIYLGLGTQPANGTYPLADFVGFVFDPSSGMTNAANNWGILTRKASVNTYTDTGFAYVNQWADLSFYLDATGVSFKAYTWGAVAPAKSALITANVPLSATPLCMVFHAVNGPAGTTSFTHMLDFWEIAYKPTTAVPVFRGVNLVKSF